MIRSALEYLLDLAKEKEIKTTKIDGKIFTNNELAEIRFSHQYTPDLRSFQTLEGLRHFIDQGQGIEHQCIVEDYAYLHIVSPVQVVLTGSIQPNNDNKRFIYAAAGYSPLTFSFGRWSNLEDFVIALMSQFQPCDDINEILSMLGNLANEQIQENKDDGFSQTIQIRSGLTQKSNVKVENPVTLTPFRTFTEVEQPSSTCILRLRNDNNFIQCSLHESDGGLWKIWAIDNIRSWLQKQIPSVAVIG